MKMLGLLLLASVVYGAEITPERSNIQAQFRFNYLTINDGLSHNKVNAICQDNEGFMWFGTNEGLNKYDGKNITVYKYDPLYPTSIKENLIKDLLVDSHGDLWIGLDGRGLNIYDKDKDVFLECKYNDGKNPFNYPVALFEDANGLLWTCSNDTLFCLDSKTHQIVNYWKYSKSPPNNRILCIYEDSRGNLWVGTRDDGLYLFNPKTQRFLRFRNGRKDSKSINGICINTIYQDRSGNLWVGTDNSGLNLYNYDDSTFTNLMIDEDHERSSRIRAIVEDKSGNLWIGARSGLYLKDKMDNVFYRYAHIDHDFSILSNNSIYDIYIDANEVMWIGTYAGGVNNVNLEQKGFVHYPAKKDNCYYLNDKIVFCFAEDKHGNFWIGTENGGINYFNRKTSKFVYYEHNPDSKNTISSNNVKAIVIDDSGNLWIGTYQGGLDRYNVKTNTFTHYVHNPRNQNSINDNNVYALLLDSDNELWLGTSSGLDLYRMKQKQFIHFNGSKDNQYKYLDDVRVIYKDSEGKIWLGTFRNGLFFLDRERNVTHFHDELFTEAILSIYEDTRGNLWFGGNNGLFWLDRESNQVVNHKGANGILLHTVYGILEDESGNLWLSTSSSGLIKYTDAVNHPEKPDFRKYDISDGIQSKQFTYNAYYKSRTGELFFGGIDGFNSFYPEKIKDNPYKPRVAITNFKIFNEPVPIGEKFGERIILQKSVTQTDEIVLSYKDNVFTFDFAAFHYANPLKNQYAYILEGFEKKWNYVGTGNSATYTNIDPGEYVFRVKASNSDGMWNEEGAQVKVIVTPPFWVTLWFRLLVIFIITASIYLLYRQRTALMRRRNQELEQKVAERTKALNKKTHALEAAKKETDNILYNVNEGLFLLNRKYAIGSQYALILEQIFERKKLGQINFFDLLRNHIAEEHLSILDRYLNLMFREDIIEHSLDELNPANQLEMQFEGGKRSKYLTIKFNRISGKRGKIVELMATVRDVTEQVLLEQKLAESEKRTNRKMDWMLGILHVEPELLKEFIENVQRELDYIEGILELEQGTDDYHVRLEKIYRSMHLIKGNASLLALKFFADLAHQFEDNISEIQKKPDQITGSDLKQLKESLYEMRESIMEVHGLLDRISEIHTQMRPKRSYERKLLLQSFENLTKQMGSESGKIIKLKANGFKIDDIPYKSQLLVKEILIQFIRNSIAHGIELPEERKRVKKSRQAVIELTTFKDNGFFAVKVRDDGRGIQVEKLRKRLKESGKWPEKEIDTWTEEQVVDTIFLPGVTTADDVDEIAGRGVGMDLVKDKINLHKGDIKIDFEKGKFCQFTVTLPVEN
jgi:ligand-binding sensor domain-containing protein/signal transduction histidine kinase